MKEICALALCLLVTLCSATTPLLHSVTPLDCNATQLQTELATDLINEDRDEGFVLRPVRTESVFQQESGKLKGGFVYYIDFDVVETQCSVLSGKNWKECNENIPIHELVFGHCKAIIFIARPWRILKLVNYNCTLSTVPPRTIHRMCPDCPSVVSHVTDELTAKVNHLVERFNTESNQTNYFKKDDIERVRSQWVVGPSYFFLFTIKETECVKTQATNLAECNFKKDNEAHVGFCKGSAYTSIEKTESFDVTCEIYEPRDDDDVKHEHCGSGQDDSKLEKKGEKEIPDAKGPGGKGRDHHRHRHGHKHHRCHPDHHHGHHEHPQHHHHHHEHPHHGHHHHHHLNDTQHHGNSHHRHNHTTFGGHSSSSEENNDNKPHEKPPKGSVQIYFNAEDLKSLPTPTIFRIPPQPGQKRKHKYDNINFPSEHSPLATCPGEPLVDLPQPIKDLLFV